MNSYYVRDGFSYIARSIINLLLGIIPICTWLSASSFFYAPSGTPVMLNQTVTSAILTIRTWAIWESSRRLRIALLLFAVVIWAATFLCVLQIFKSIKSELFFSTHPQPP
jgi:hypothetical protein